MTLKRSSIVLLATAVVAMLIPTTASAAEHKVTHETVKGQGVTIAITVFQPAGASATSQAPVVLQSHGWAGSRETEISPTVKPFLDAGMGVVSIDQRGHGESGGQANVQDPTMETEDIKNVIDYVATLDWVRLDGPGDPVLGAIGGSYGGGYQTMTALDEIRDEGRTRFNALAPQITWYDLPESLAPQKVVRSAWNIVLYSAGSSMVPDYIHEAFVWGTTTGQWPDGTLYDQPVPVAPDLDSEFHKHSPVSFVEKGIRIDVPVLLRQGTTDNLFNLNEGLHIFNKAVTDEARDQSFFVAYNGGHALPNAVPPGEPVAAELGGGTDACSRDGNFTKTTIDFFERVFAGSSTDGVLPKRYNLTTLTGDKCLSMNSIADRSAKFDPLGTGTIATTAGAGTPIHLPVTEGPRVVTGVPTLKGTLAAAGLDSRAFFGLSIGTTPADARVIQNNVLPLRQVMPTTEKKFNIELPGVVAEIPEGQSLFLTISPVSDMYFGHGSRTPGALTLTDLTLTLPQPGDGPCKPKKNNGKGKGHAYGHQKKACGSKPE